MNVTTTMDERAETFRQHLLDFTDGDGLILGEINARGPRTFCNEDFKGYETWDFAAGDYAGYLPYEDSIMTTGRFIHAEVLRHLATGREPGLELAERCGRAIIAVSAAGDQHESGYLPKPHGGLAGAHRSRCISVDQYEHALFGMWALRHTTRDVELAAKVEEAIVKWADYFRRHDFEYDYFGRVWAIPENGVHGLGLFLPLSVIARGITGDNAYLDAVEKRLGAIVRGSIVEGVNPYGHGHPNTVNLTVMGLVYCWRHDVYKDECARGIEVWTRKTLKRLSSDNLAYCYEEGSDTHPAEPRYVDHPTDLGFKFQRWRSNVKGADACKIAHTLVLAHNVLPRFGWRDKAIEILERFQQVNDFRRYHDYDGRQMPEDYAYMRDYLCNQFVGAWLEAYYLAKRPDLIAETAL